MIVIGSGFCEASSAPNGSNVPRARSVGAKSTHRGMSFVTLVTNGPTRIVAFGPHAKSTTPSVMMPPVNSAAKPPLRCTTMSLGRAGSRPMSSSLDRPATGVGTRTVPSAGSVMRVSLPKRACT